MSSTKIHDVTTLQGGSVIIENPSREIMYLATALQAVKAEARGFKLCRGPKVTPQILKRFGLKRSTPLEQVIARIEAEIDAVRAQIATFNAGGDEVRG